MAKGTNLIFDVTPSYIANGDVDLVNDSWKVALISDSITSLLVSEVNPKIGSTNINEVSPGGSYTAGGIALTTTTVSAGSEFSFLLDTGAHSAAQVQLNMAAGSPTNIKTAVIYDFTTASGLAVCYYDLTEDGGSTAINLESRDLVINFGVSAVGASAAVGEIFRIKTSN